MSDEDLSTEIVQSFTRLPASSLRLAWATPGRGRESVDLDGDAVLGAAEGVDLRIAGDAAVSRFHAEISFRDGAPWIRDLGSRNGTFVDGFRVESAELPTVATLRIGDTDITATRHTIEREEPFQEGFGPIVGSSLNMQELFRRLKLAAQSEATVLVLGETGTGKELVAEAVHTASTRSKGPFVVVDCATLSPSLLEAELFGHVRGAFTGAVSDRAGAFEAATGGTVFLDEIGELPIELQPKLLRVLESRRVRRVGENRVRQVDVRFVAATHRDLMRMVAEGRFREDLYFRLSVLVLKIPPLRQRRDDIPTLIRRFAAKPALWTGSALQQVRDRSWTGNVRELRNFVARAEAFGLDEALAGAEATPDLDTDMGLLDTTNYHEAREDCVARFEREFVRTLLARNEGNVSAAARMAGLDRTHLHRLIRKHGLEV